MPSTAAITARNRNNARHSTGPRTQQGKHIASKNARKHGFTVTTHRVLSNEDPAEYATFEEEIVAIYAPKSPRERLAAIDIAKARWALRRFDEAELLLLDACLCTDEQTPGETIASLCTAGSNTVASSNPTGTSLDLLMRYRRPWDRRHQEALREFSQARQDRHREERLTMAQEREAQKQFQQEQSQALKATKAMKEIREMQHVETLLGFRAPNEALTPLGFVSSPHAGSSLRTHL